MSHFCRICRTYRPNERFSGGGHKVHICKTCAALPPDRLAELKAVDEIENFLFHQSHISSKNMKRLHALSLSGNSRVAALASVVAEVAKVAPHKRKRFSILRRESQHLLDRMEKLGLILNETLFIPQTEDDDSLEFETH